MTTIPFDYDVFTIQIPEYSNPTLYPEETIDIYWDLATNYVSNVIECSVLSEKALQYALNLMTAHLIALNKTISAGRVTNLVQQSSIDKISVGLLAPPVPNQYAWWLNQTSRGQQLYALFQVNSVSGFYVGGTPTRFGVSTLFVNNCDC